MSPVSVLSVTLLLGFATYARSLECNEGFRINIGGIPLYHWMERTCTGNSKCFAQELRGTYGVPVAFRYGACISSVYDTYLDCVNLFGPSSNFDPALLLNLIPEITDRVTDTVNDFVNDTAGQLTILFSDGQGSIEFIDGVFTFYTNLGFNVTKALPLKQPLANLLNAAFSGNSDTLNKTALELINAIANLDTENQEFTDAIYNLIDNIDTSGTTTQNTRSNPFVAALIEKLPGLLRSMLPSSYSPALWYDVAFALLNQLNISMPKQTAEDMLEVINATYNIPADVRPYTDLFFGRIPGLVDQLAKGNFAYTGNWSLNLLMEVSEENNATTAFSDALITFLETITGQTLQYEFRKTITWMPGLFYRFFPNDKSEIEEVYNKIADGLKTFDFTNITNTAQPTDLSDLLINLIESSTGQALDDFYRAVVINFSRLFYNLLSDYSTYVESFFSILKEGLSTWPNINAGNLIRELIVEFNATVPPEIDPLLTHLQPILTEALTAAGPGGINVTALLDAMTTMVDAYKTSYPNSPFPTIVERLLDYTRELVYFNFTQAGATTNYGNLINEILLLSIDLQFAIMNSINATTDQLTQMLIQSFPAYETYINLFQLLQPEDIKQLVRDIITWIVTGPPYTSQGFVNAIRTTVDRITASINSILGDIRAIFKPESCQYTSCNTDLCNTREYTGTPQPPATGNPADATTTSRAAADMETTPLEAVATTTSRAAADMETTPLEAVATTTDDGERTTANVFLNIAALWILFKASF